MILLITFLYCCGYLNTVALYYSIDEEYKSEKLTEWWPVLAVLFWWVVSLYLLQLILFRNK